MLGGEAVVTCDARTDLAASFPWTDRIISLLWIGIVWGCQALGLMAKMACTCCLEGQGDWAWIFQTHQWEA